MFDASPDTPPPVALRASDLQRQRGVPYEADAPDPIAHGHRESGIYLVSAGAAAYLAEASTNVTGVVRVADSPEDADEEPVSEAPRSLAASNLARVLEALRQRI